MKKRLRSQTLGRSSGSALFVSLIGGYFALVLLGVGFAYPKMVHDVAPGRHPIRLLNEYLLTAFLSLLAARFFLQRSPKIDVRPYLHLPVRRIRLVRFAQVMSLISLLNVLPFFFFVPVWIGNVRTATPNMMGAVFWGSGIVLILLLTHYTNTLLRVLLSQRMGVFLSVLGALAGMLVLDEILALRIMSQASDWLFGGLLRGRAGPLLVLTALTGSAVVVSSRVLHRGLGATAELRRRSTWNGVDSFFGRGPIGTLLLLDLRLIARNERPRQLLLATTLLLIAFGVLIMSGEQATDPLMQTLLGLYITGLVPLTYGQLLFSWNSSHFDGLITHALYPRTLIRARLLLLQGFCILSFLIALPFLGWFVPQLIRLSIAFFFYNAGVTCVLATFTALWNRKRVTLSRSTVFNYQGFSTHHYLILALLFIPPIVLPLLLETSNALFFLAGLGVLGLALTPLWISTFSKLFQRRRYIMAAGFRQAE